MEWKHLKLDQEGNVAIMTINKPAKMNNMDLQFLYDMVKAINVCEKNREIRCVVLTGASNKAFAAGGDVKAEQLAEETAKMAKKLSGGATKTFAATQALLNESMTRDLESQMERERLLMVSCADTEDFKEGCTAMFEKRRPQFKGR